MLIKSGKSVIAGMAKPGPWRMMMQLLAVLFVWGLAAAAHADNCSDYPYSNSENAYVVDGNNIAVAPSALTIDVKKCIIRNWPASHPYGGSPTPAINFDFPPGYGLLLMENVYFNGNMSCSNFTNPDGSKKGGIWFINGSVWAANNGNQCQDLIIPVEKIDKQVPGPTATVGVPFSYSLTIPIMYVADTSTFCQDNPSDPSCQAVQDPNLGSPNDLGNIHVTDDLTATATGAEMTLVSMSYHLKSDPPGTSNPITNLGDSKHLDFWLPDIPKGEQVVVDLQVVLDDPSTAPTNVTGTQFINTAAWSFSRVINGVTFDPLPGESGVSPAMTIVGPDMVMTKSTPSTAINPSSVVDYTLDAQNIGGADAWDVVLQDVIPSDTTAGSGVGMCQNNPITYGSGLTAKVVAADGTTVVRTLQAGDFTATWGGTTGPDKCTLNVTLADAGGPVKPNEFLRVTYQTALDPGASTVTPAPSGDLVNVAGAISWYNGDDASRGPQQTTKVLTDGTPSTTDFQDNASVTVAVSGYYFEKTAENLATAQNPATSAASGDALRYRVHLFNVDQNIDNIQIADVLDSRLTSPTISRCEITGSAAVTVTPVCSISGGTLTVSNGGSGGSLALPQGDDLIVEFDTVVASGLANGDTISNQAHLSATGITSPVDPASGDYASDDPNVNGVSDPNVDNDQDPTVITIVTPGPLDKANPANTDVTIGETFSYTITVPATPVDAPLYDVHILDSLPANLRYVSASAQVGGGTTMALADSDGGADNNLDLREVTSGLDIPAGQQAVVTLQAVVRNDAVNQDGVTFTNTASYTYSRINGGAQTDGSGTSDTTGPMTIREPVLTSSKTVTDLTGNNPAVGGDTLEYVIQLNNTATVAANDVNIVDALPSDLILDSSFTPTLTINGSQPAGFNPAPSQLADGSLIWGRNNGDDSLDIPASGTLILTFRATLNTVTGSQLLNNVSADWTSLNGVVNSERNGFGCPNNLSSPDDYCTTAQATYPEGDTTSFTKTQTTDSWNADGSTANDGLARVGDTVTYDLTLNLHEGQTSAVVVTDDLPAGQQLQSYTLIKGNSGISFNPATPVGPSAGDTGTLTWNLGDITDTPDGNSSNDTLVIEYVAQVVTGSLSQVASSTLTNNAQLTYTGAASALPGSASVDVYQPIMTDLVKTDTAGGRTGSGTQADPYRVDLANDQMQFHLETCNNGQAPAYDVALSDTLDSQLDESALASAPVVTLGGTTLSAGSDFTYSAPARGGTMSIALADARPVMPGACLTVDYAIGFHTDVTTTTAFHNGASLDTYWSLPATSGEQYSGNASPSQVWMQNTSNPQPPVKALVSPATEATIGQAVTYTITVPADNIIRNNVTVSDTLPAQLAYDSATVSVNGGAASALSNAGSGQALSFNLGTLQAGDQAVVTLVTHVANTVNANAGDTFSNTASYIYDGGTAQTSNASNSLLVVEPLVNVAKQANVAQASAGDTVTYTVTLSAQSGSNNADAYDLVLTDSLSAGLQYVPGTTVINGSPAADPTVSGSPQTLTWPARDMAKGDVVTVAYQVKVQDTVSPGQILQNTAQAAWTSLAGANSNERTGADGAGGLNDYVNSATVDVGAPDNTALTKTRLTDSFGAGDSDVRVGDRIDYQLKIDLEDGTYNQVQLADSLPAGLVFEKVVSANYFGTDASGDPTATPSVSGDGSPANPQTLSWNWNQLVNPSSSSTDSVIIVYRARVLNNTLSTAPTAQTLSNSATLDYQYPVNGSLVAAPQKTSQTSVTLLQPHLTVAKNVTATSGGDNVIVAGETVTYSVDIHNDGTAPAYDPVLVDTLPVGMRNTGGPTNVVVTLVDAGGASSSRATLAPVYTSATGVATWDFKSPADEYTIAVGATLHVQYQVQADNDLGANQTLTNSANVSHYYSFDDDALPVDGQVSDRQDYGATPASAATLTSQGAGALSKATTQPTATLGEPFPYQITVPAQPVDTQLSGVHVLDDLSSSAAKLGFVSARYSLDGGSSWSAMSNVGSATSLDLVDQASGNGVDIPASGQMQVELTVRLLDDPTNVAGLTFRNTATYNYTNFSADPATLAGTSGDMTVTEPALVMTKNGPGNMSVGTPDTFTLDVQNTGTSKAWNITLTDHLPNLSPGGMCQYPPTITTAAVYAADGTTLVTTLQSTDYTTGFSPAPSACSPCVLTLAGQTAQAALDPGQILRVQYQASLDDNTPVNSQLTNYAGATRWSSLMDTTASDVRIYTHTLQDQQENNADPQDFHTLTSNPPVMTVNKTVAIQNDLNGDGLANPGDTLRYTVQITNTSPVVLPGFSVVDDLGALNPALVFKSNTLQVVSISDAGASDNSQPGGGTNKEGLVDISNLTLAGQGNSGDTVTLV
ncbi:MAG: isopeptide-forming domain-containing fimbrial protein, partial [Alcanivorax sp.]|nr:isopeptide-forming domain-containing fimbrial protein [Alcanivorax sp.]